MAKHVGIVGLLMLAAMTSSVAQARRMEVALAPGPFSAITDAQLGKSVNFENEINTHSCLPLLIGGKTVAWLERAYTIANRLFVRRCTASGSSDLVARGNRAGGANSSWDRAAFDVRRGVRFSPLSLPRWSFMSNPTFCNSYIAYWGLQGGANRLTPIVYDLIARVQVASRTLGPVPLETDDEAYLPPPTWDASCSIASFDGRRIAKGQITLTVAK
jgi:hypothetical protein